MAERGLPRAAPNPDTLAPLFPSHPFPSLPFPVLFPAFCAGAVIFVSGSGAPPQWRPPSGGAGIFFSVFGGFLSQTALEKHVPVGPGRPGG